jgi:hypothetical protein
MVWRYLKRKLIKIEVKEANVSVKFKLNIVFIIEK